MKARGLVAAAMAAAAATGWALWPDGDRHPVESTEAGLVLPELSAAAAMGERLFEKNCIACHGRAAAGSANGPPLVHRLYEPGHHSNAAFQFAARNGVRAHHWQFGDMPPVAGVSEGEVALITTYVRELQRANGIR